MQVFKSLQKHVRNFFGISSVEANAFIILLPMMLIILFLFPFYHYFIPSEPMSFKMEREQIKNLLAELEKIKESPTEEYQGPSRLLSYTDPNTADFKQLIVLNLDTVVAARIIKYRNKGGSFKYKEDLLNIYGLTNQKYSEVQEWINLPQKPRMELTSTTQQKTKNPESTNNSTKEVAYKDFEMPSFDINQADTSDLTRIYGIGPVLSSRIIKYRDLLGGFVDTTQYKEVYGLKAEVLQQLYTAAVIDNLDSIKQLNINKASASELSKHPYISWKVANAIVAYRNQHGEYLDKENLLNIKLINHKTFNKLVPYLSL